MKQGRPTKYKEEYDKLAFQMCKEFGSTNKKLGKVFQVDEKTINLWINEHENFCLSVKEGKRAFDTKGIEISLAKRAMGYDTTETTTYYDGDGVVVKKKVMDKEVPADIGSMKMWLSNRNCKEWQDKQNIDLGGDVNINVNTGIERE